MIINELDNVATEESSAYRIRINRGKSYGKRA